MSIRKVIIAAPNTPFATAVSEALRRMGGYQSKASLPNPSTYPTCLGSDSVVQSEFTDEGFLLQLRARI